MHQRQLSLILLFSLVAPLVLVLDAVPTAGANHSGIRNADAFKYTATSPNRNVSYNTTGGSWGATDLWRSGVSSFGDATVYSASSSQSSSACSSSTTPGATTWVTIWFTKQTGQHPKANYSALDTRYMDGVSIIADVDSSGSTTACGYIFVMTAVVANIGTPNATFTETETFAGKCGKLGGGNAANGNTQQTCTLSFSNRAVNGIRVYCNSAFSSYAPACKINEMTGNGIDPTPPTQTPTLTVTPQGCTNNVAWTTTSDTTTYKVYRADGPGFNYTNLTPLTTVAHPGAGYTDVGLGSGKAYYYQDGRDAQDRRTRSERVRHQQHGVNPFGHPNHHLHREPTDVRCSPNATKKA